ncbi:MAG TPA: helix-turn-helix domain-containing protein [Phenylobacterium sp.]|nr:helix-turn-helix domain-containing protein [Phenylobacterium sp.]
MITRAKAAYHATSSVKARALDAAARILAAQGVEQLNLRSIAEAAGIGTGSIYHYFESKDELLLNLALMGFEDLRRDILQQQADPKYGSPMRGAARAFLTLVGERQALFSVMFSERLLAGFEQLREAEQRAFEAYRRAVLTDGRIPPEHQEDAALAIWALGRGIAAVIHSYPQGKAPPEVVERLLAGGRYLIERSAA